MKVIELKKLAKQHQLKGYSKLRKQELIDLLNENNINIKSISKKKDTSKKVKKIPIDDPKSIYQFYSRSKDLKELPIEEWRKRLSNFYMYKKGIKIGEHKYLSVEHYYQSQKYAILGFEDLAELFTLKQNKYKTSLDAKRGGNRKTMEKYNLTLPKEWTTRRNIVMEYAVKEKVKQDDITKQILILTKNHPLVHFERCPNSYWGAKVKDGKIIGFNKLGKIFMGIRDKLDI